MIPQADLPHPDTLPIPKDAGIGTGWTEQMLEMADHVGVYATLLIVDRFGGEELYIAQDPARSPFLDLIGRDLAGVMAHVYGKGRIRIPTGKAAIRYARRQGVVAAVRAHQLTVNDAARILRTSRTYMSHLVNQTSEGLLSAPTPRPRIHDARQMDMFGDE